MVRLGPFERRWQFLYMRNGSEGRLAGLVVNFVPTTGGDFAPADRTGSEQNARISHGWSGEVHTLFGRERSQCVFQLLTQTI